MTAKQEHAFPQGMTYGGSGMTLRDYFAAAGATGIIAGASRNMPADEIAKQAYQLADAMLEARK